MRRVSELVRREVANVVSGQLNDPRMRLVTVTAVEVTKDIRHAKVFVTHMEQTAEPDHAAVVDTLNKAAGYIRHEISRHLDLKNCPALRFFYDHSVERGVNLSNLIDRVNSGKQAGN